MPNVDHFADLPTDMQDALLDYIALNRSASRDSFKSPTCASVR